MVDVEKLLGALIVTLHIWWSYTFVVFMTRRVWMAMKRMEMWEEALRRTSVLNSSHPTRWCSINPPHSSAECREISDLERQRERETSGGSGKGEKHGKNSFPPKEIFLAHTYYDVLPQKRGKLSPETRVGSCCDNFHIENMYPRKGKVSRILTFQS